jgi:HEAT repeat protein
VIHPTASIRTSVKFAATCAAAMLLVQAATAQPKDSERDILTDVELRRRLEPLVPSVRSALQGDNADAQRAALAIAADFPPALLVQANLSGAIGTFLGRDIKDADLVALGIRSFGKSYPEKPDLAIKVLERFAKSENVAVRRAVADALASLVQMAVPSMRMVAHATYFIDASKAALPLMAEMLKEKDGTTQRAILGGVQTVSRVVIDLYVYDSGPIGEEPKPKDRAERLAPLAPVLKALAGVVPELTYPLASNETETRTAAARTIELLAALRRVVNSVSSAGNGPAAEPLAGGWPTLRAAVADRMRDDDSSVRLAVTEALEALGDAAEARPLLRAATADRNVFVRWAAARALGKSAPEKPKSETVAEDVAALARLLSDADIDVRMAALNALARFGSAARSATPAVLAAAGRGDVEPRVVAVRTMAALETEAAPTVPVLIRGLSETDLRLRRAAAAGLVRFGPDARPALPELRRAVLSTDSELRLAAAEAILAIERTPRLKDL